MADYTKINHPFDDQLAREPDGLDLVVGGGNFDKNTTQQQPATPAQAGGNTAASSSAAGGPVQQASVASGGAIADILINNSIQSSSWLPRKMGFYINGQTGYAEFTNVYVSGNINATTGFIGGWTINATTITGGDATLDSTGVITLGTGNNIVKLSAVDSTYRVWVGNATAASAPFSVTKAGAISATSGTIGGNALSSTTISSTTFVSGPLGSGWSISNTGTAEFQNVTVRGVIRTSVFEKDTVSAVNGIVLVSKADVLASDMTALDASTLTITGESSFVANEVIRMKDGTDDEWMLVTNAASAPTYTVTRDLAGSYTANNNPVWKKGTAVVSMGVGTGTRTGFILLDSSSANSPYIDIYARNSNTFSDYTLHARLGWLQGITDADVGLSGTDVWGLYTDNAYIKGVIVANTGYIGGTSGWVISSQTMTSTSGGNTTILSSGATAFTAGPTGTPTITITQAGVLTATGGTITGGTIQSAASGTRFVMTNATQRYETLNSNGDIVATMNWSSTTAAVLKLSPIHDARRALEIVLPASFAGAGAESDAEGITIANAADSISINITDGGIIGLRIGACDTYGILVASAPSGGPGLYFSYSGADNPVIELSQNGTSSGSYGIKITQGTAGLKAGLFIDDNAESNLAFGIEIDRDGSSTSNVIAMKIDSQNASSGDGTGIDIIAKSTAILVSSAEVGVNLTSTTSKIKVGADTTAAGAYKGRIRIDVGGTTQYLHYFDA